MEKQRYSLRTNIGYFLNKPNGFSRDFHMEFPEIFLEPDINIFDFYCNYRFSRTHEGLLLHADLKGVIEVPCVRCLTLSRLPVATSFEELYVFVERAQDESDQVIPGDGYIDLTEIFRDYLLLEIPIKYICKPDCKGVCVECGQNLNLAECEHTESRIHFLES